MDVENEPKATRIRVWSPDHNLAGRSILNSAPAGTLLLLPDKISDDGKAHYRDDIAGLVKTAKAAGVALEYSFPKEAREFLSEYSAGGESVSLALGIVGNLLTDGVKMAVTAIRIRVQAATRKVGKEVEEAEVHLRIAEYCIEGDRKTVRGLEYTGPVAGAERALLAALESPGHHAHEGTAQLNLGSAGIDE